MDQERCNLGLFKNNRHNLVSPELETNEVVESNNIDFNTAIENQTHIALLVENGGKIRSAEYRHKLNDIKLTCS